jgi:hypothetical protein
MVTDGAEGASITVRFLSPKEKTTVKRMLLVLSAAVLALSSLAVPTAVRADGGNGGGSQNCPPPTVCKP